MNKSHVIRSVVFGAALLGASPALAAQQGPLAPSSTGTITVSGTVEDNIGRAQISGLDDITFGVINQANNGVIFRDTICIYHTSPTFGVTFFQLGEVNAALKGPNNGSVSLSLGLGGVAGVGGAQTLGEFMGPINVSTRSLVGNRVSPTCQTGPTQQLLVNYVLPGTPPPPGAYSASIEVRISVE